MSEAHDPVPGVPRRGSPLVLAVATTVAAAAATASTIAVGSGRGPVPVALLIVVGLTLSSNLAPLGVPHGRVAPHVTIDEAILVVALSVDPRWAAVGIGIGTLLGQSLRGRPPAKVALHVGAVTLSASFATWAYLAVVAPDGVGSVGWAVATLVAAGTHGLCSLLLLGLAHRAVEGAVLRDLVRNTLAINAMLWTASWAVGVLLGLAASVHQVWLTLGSVVLLGLHLGYRGYAAVRSDRDEVERLRQFSRALGRTATDDDAIGDALGIVARQFSARSAILGFDELDGRRTYVFGSPPDALMDVHLARATASGQSVRVGSGDAVLALVAPIVRGGVAVGVLAVGERVGVEPWGETDVALLETLAAEIGVSASNVQLLRQVERERARLEEESSKLADVLGAATDGIVVVGAEGAVSTWNAGMSAITGIAPADALGRAWWSVLRLKDREGRELLPGGGHAFQVALSGQRVTEPVALEVLRSDGSWRWVRSTFAPLVHEGGAVDGVVVVARDVTAERELAELKTDFVATVSHELRTPLTPLKGFVATLQARGDALDDDQRALLLEAMAGQVGRLERLVGDLLLVADIDRETLTLHAGIVDLHEEATAALLAETAEDRARVRLSSTGNTPAVGDRKAVERIVRSLVSNATKHTAGEVRVETGVETGVAWLAVTDEGPGIPPWEHDRVFERFHRLGDHLLRTQGPGLGLSIARALAEELGGSISLRSEVGLGSTFRLELPAVEHRAGIPV